LRVVRPSSREEFRRLVEEARRGGLLLYVSAAPCPGCESFEAALKELGVDTSGIVKVVVPPDEWAVGFVLEELGVSGAPSVVTPEGEVLDDFDPVALAARVRELAGKKHYL